MRKDFGTFGGVFFHLYADSGGGSQWTAKPCFPSISEYNQQSLDEVDTIQHAKACKILL